MRELLPYLSLLRRYPRPLILGSALLLATLLSGIGLLAVSGWFITATGLAGLAAAAGVVVALELYVPSGAIRFFAISRTLARYGERVVNHNLILRLLAELRGHFFRRLLPLEPAALSRFRSADLLSRISADIDTLDALYLRILAPSLAALLSLLLVALLSPWLAPQVLLPLLLWLVVAGFGLPLLAARLGQRHGEALIHHRSQLRTTTLDGFAGLGELRSLGALHRHQAHLEREEGRYRSLRRRLTLSEALGQATATLAGQLGVILAASLGVIAFQQGAISGPVLGLLVVGALGLAEVIAPLPAAWFHLGRTRAAARRLNEVVDQPICQTAPTALAPMDHSLSLVNVDLRWQPHTPTLLAQASLLIPSGHKVLLSGPSGSGKSSIVALFTRLAEAQQGEVLLGGAAVNTIPHTSLYQQLACLTQGSEIFADTIAANLRIARPEASDGQLWQALQIAALDETVAALPEGLNTWTGAGGTRLSGGQARRLALARVVLRDAPIVILDEPTTGLDPNTAATLAERLTAWLKGRTALIISHDTTQLPHYDAHYRLEGGKFVAQKCMFISR